MNVSTFMAEWEWWVWIGLLYARQRSAGGTLVSNFFFFKWLHESFETLKVTPRSNKGCLFVEILGYHNGAWSGCLQVPVGVKIGDCVWVFFWSWGKRHDMVFYWLQSELRLVIEHVSSFWVGEEAVVSLKIKTLNLNQVWKKLKGHEILSFEKYYSFQAKTYYMLFWIEWEIWGI